MSGTVSLATVAKQNESNKTTATTTTSKMMLSKRLSGSVRLSMSWMILSSSSTIAICSLLSILAVILHPPPVEALKSSSSSNPRVHASWTTTPRSRIIIPSAIAPLSSSRTTMARTTMHPIKYLFGCHCRCRTGVLESTRSSEDGIQENDQHRHHQKQKQPESSSPRQPAYDLGLGKNKPIIVANARRHSCGSTNSIVQSDTTSTTAAHHDKNGQSNSNAQQLDNESAATVMNWVVPDPVRKPTSYAPAWSTTLAANASNQRGSSSKATTTTTTAGILKQSTFSQPKTTRRMVPRDEASQPWRKALWDEMHFSSTTAQQQQQQAPPIAATTALQHPATMNSNIADNGRNMTTTAFSSSSPFLQSSMMSSPDSLVKRPTAFYPDIDLSIPESVYSSDASVDLVWDLIRWEAWQEAQREPLLVSFLHSTILNHPSLESSLAFLLANRLQSPAMMISTQLQSLILDALRDNDVFRRSLRADMMAVRDRDPACTCLPDVFLYFKGFHALQSYRVAHVLWLRGKRVLAQYLQSQVSQVFQIDIHPNATLGSGIMLDHGTGIVIGETARVGHNCSILHHVTLGGSGKKGVDRHPQVGNGVLLGAGATLLGPVQVGDGSQVGAGTLVISNLPPHSVAVGVPARIIGSFIDVTEQPSIEMNQMIDTSDSDRVLFESEGI